MTRLIHVFIFGLSLIKGMYQIHEQEMGIHLAHPNTQFLV